MPEGPTKRSLTTRNLPLASKPTCPGLDSGCARVLAEPLVGSMRPSVVTR